VVRFAHTIYPYSLEIYYYITSISDENKLKLWLNFSPSGGTAGRPLDYLIPNILHKNTSTNNSIDFPLSPLNKLIALSNNPMDPSFTHVERKLRVGGNGDWATKATRHFEVPSSDAASFPKGRL
jgi:hypothetical protein